MRRRRAGLVVVALVAVLLVPLLGPRLWRFGWRLVRKAERAAGLIDVPAPRERASTPQGLSIWVVDDSTKVRPGDALGEPLGSSASPVSLQAARGETVAFQLVLAAPQPVLLDVRPGALTGAGRRIEPTALELFVESFLDTPRVDPSVVGLGPGEYPDALVPLRERGASGRAIASPVRLTPRRNQPLWVDLAVPRDAVPGTYHGTLRVTPEGLAGRDVPLVLEVLPFEIPSTRHLFAWVPLYATRFQRREGLGDEPDLGAYTRLYHAYQEMAHAHRFWTQIIEEQPHARWNEASGALLGVDWSAYDAINGQVLDGSLFEDREPPPQWKVGGFVWWGARPGDPPHFGGDYKHDASLTPAHRRAIAEYAHAFRAHFDERGWTRPRLFAYVIDEPDFGSYPKLPGLVGDYGRALHEAHAGIDHLVTVAPRSDLLGTVDIWATWGAGYVPDRMAQRQRAGEHAWFYQQHEPFVGGNCVNDEGLAMRSWPWIAWRYRVDGIFLWVGNFWNEDPYRQAVNWDDDLLGNGVLFYPGHLLPTIGFPAVDGPIASLRMKALRRGLLDYEYFELLRQTGGAPDALVAGIVRSALNEGGWEPHWRHPRWERPGDWSHEPAEWDAARRAAARQILARLAAAAR
jgi:hypothetical protein